jgi:hypothetical protein
MLINKSQFFFIKFLPVIMLVLSLFVVKDSFTQNIYFNYTDGTSASYNLQDVRKVTFTDDVMNLHLWDGAIYSWNVSTIGHYEYNETANIEDILTTVNNLNVRVFPNPVNTNLHVQFNTVKEDLITVSLFDLNGNVLIEKNLGKLGSGAHQEILELLKVPQGTYVCRISGQQSSITKQVVKQ